MSTLQKIPNAEALIDLLPVRDRNGKGRPFKFESWMGTAGNFTFVLIENGKEKFIGVTKRNPVDKDTGPTALQIAAVRAYRTMKGLSDEDAGYGRQRPVTRKQAKLASAQSLVASVYDRVRQ